jgi:predicted enzyme related to lactoylglutathione lyase
MANTIQIIVFPVKDVEKAKKFYNTFLGTEPYVDSPYYVGYKVGDMEVGLDPNATGGSISYIDVDDIKTSLQAMSESGAEIVQDPTDVGAGLLIAKIKDADGTVVGLRQQP